MPSSSSSIKQRKKKQKQKQKQRKLKLKVREATNNSFSLPQEIITNILKRLPVKSVIRFQCVCKSWKTLIQSQSFAHENFHYYSIHNPRLLFRHFFPRDSTQLYFLNNDMQIVPLNCSSVSHILCCSYIIGSSNGLICLGLSKSSHDGFVLWNPSTAQLRYAPKPENNDCFRVGFGFSSIMNDYNIISIDYPSGVLDTYAQVYSFKTGSWKKVESSLVRGISVSNENIVFNGSILLLGEKYDVYLDSIEEVIVSYDMALEVFTLIPTPVSPIDGLNSLYTRITIHENKLAILYCTSMQDRGSSLIDLWVMEDGMGKSGERWGWTKKFSISHPSLCFALTIWRNKMVCYPSCTCATDGEKLAHERRSIGLVDLTTSEVDMFDIGIYGPPYPLLNHVESLFAVGNNHIEEL